MAGRVRRVVVPAVIGLLGLASLVAAPANSAIPMQASGWQAPVEMDPYRVLTTVSCPTDTFCVAADTTGGVFVQRDGSWGPSEQLGAKAFLVSCATESMCVAAGGEVVTTYDGTSWSTPRTIDAGASILGLSCPGTAFCVATDDLGRALTFDGARWHRQALTTDELADVSCASNAFCMAVEQNDGGVWMFDGTDWTEDADVTPDGSNAITCSSSSWCVVSDYRTEVQTYDGSGWSGLLEIDHVGFIRDLSCSSSTFCMAVDDHGAGVVFDGSSWTRAQTAELWLQSVSCPSEGHCEALGHYLGVALSYREGWKSTTFLESRAGNPTAVSCATPRFCMAVDTYGNAIRFQRGHWNAPDFVIPVDLYAPIDSVSCPSSAFCAAVSHWGQAAIYQNGSWSQSQEIHREISSVSCTSKTFCLAVGWSPNPVQRFDGSTWSKARFTGHETALESVSCVSRTFCVAVGWSGLAYTYDGSTWSPTRVFKQTTGDVSCSSPTFCMALNKHGRFSVFDGTQWAKPAHLETKLITGFSCPVDGMCMAVARNPRAYLYVDGIWTKSAALNHEGGAFTGISCATRTFCNAVQYYGSAIAYRG